MLVSMKFDFQKKQAWRWPIFADQYVDSLLVLHRIDFRVIGSDLLLDPFSNVCLKICFTFKRHCSNPFQQPIRLRPCLVGDLSARQHPRDFFAALAIIKPLHTRPRNQPV